MSYTKQNFWCSAPATMTSTAQFGSYFNFSATASYRARYIQLPKLPQKTSYSFSFDVTVSSVSTQQNQVLMMDPETGTQIVNITGGKFGAYSTNAGDLTAGTSQALSNGRHTVTVSISSDPLLLITITTSGDTPTTFEAVRSTNATVINEFLAAMQHCPIFGVPYDLTNYTYYWRGYVIVKDMVITSGAETVFSAYDTFTGDMKVADYTASGTSQISGATLNMLSSGIPQFKNVFSSDMDSFEIITKMTFFKSVTYPAQAYRGGLFYLWQPPASGNYPRLYSNFYLYPTGSTYTDTFAMSYGIASDAGGFVTASSPLDLSTDLVFGQPTWYKVVVKNNVGGSRVIMQLYRSADKTNWTKIADRSVGNLGSNTYRFIFGSNWLLSFGGYSNTANGASGLMDLSETYVTSKGRVIWQAFEPSTGSVEIDKGYYNTGSGEIWMPKSKYFLDTLSSSETLGWKNNLYAVTKQGAASARMNSGALEGDYQASYDLSHPVYMNYTMDKILGDTPLEEMPFSFTNAGTVENFVKTGSLTFGANGEISGFSSSNTLKLPKIFSPTSSQSFEVSLKIKTGSSTSNIQEIFALSPPLLLRTNGGRWNLPYNINGTWNDYQQDTVSASTIYYLKVLYYPTATTVSGYTYTAKHMYLEVYNSSKSLLYRYDIANLSSNYLNFTGAETYFGSQNGSGEHWAGSIYFDEDAYIKINGNLWWTPYTVTATEISTEATGFMTNPDDSYKTYSLPNAVSIGISSFQNVKDVCGIYAVNRSGQANAGVTVDGEEPTGVLSSYRIGTAYLNAAHTGILAVDSGEAEEDHDIILNFELPELPNYTVVGSPTITNGYLVSNFSVSDYLKSTSTFSPGNDTWEVIAKVTTGADVSIEQSIFDNEVDKRGFRVGLAGTTAKRWQILVSDGSAWINTSSHYGSYVVQPNTTYWIKAGFSGSGYYLYYSLDGVNYTQDVSYNSTVKVGGGLYFTLGNKWSGSIDLSETCIKVNNQNWWIPNRYYNFSVVGSPTISSDYTASNFSGSNYLTLPTTIGSSDSSWEIGFSFITTNNSTTQFLFGCVENNTSVLFSSGSTGNFKWYLSSDGSNFDIAGGSGSYAISSNVKYYVKAQFTGTQYILSLSTDGENWTVSSTVDSTTKIAPNKTLYAGSCWGRSNEYLRGSIDLKDCYIKKNGVETWRAVSVDTSKLIVDPVQYWMYSGKDYELNNGLMSYGYILDVQGQSLLASSYTRTDTTVYPLVLHTGGGYADSLMFSDSTYNKSQGMNLRAVGYKTVFTDSNHTDIASLTRLQKYRVYGAKTYTSLIPGGGGDVENDPQPVGLCLYITPEQYESGMVVGVNLPISNVAVSSIEDPPSVQVALYPSQISYEGSSHISYNRLTDTFTIEELGIFRATLEYIGDYFVDIPAEGE